jgi:hypothetical protein
MYSSQNIRNIILAIYSDSRYVFRLEDIAMVVGETNFLPINKKLNYYVHSGKLLNPRRGIYAKPGFTPEELACKIYTPSYISLEYVLQLAGVVFQYDSRLTSVSYLSRELEINDKIFSYRKIKGEILVNNHGIEQKNNINIATPERAFLDIMYLNTTYFFDNLNVLDIKEISRLLPIYNSKALNLRVLKLLKNGRDK